MQGSTKLDPNFSASRSGLCDHEYYFAEAVRVLNENEELLYPKSSDDFNHLLNRTFIDTLKRRAANDVDEFRSLVLASAMNDLMNPVAEFEGGNLILGGEVNAVNKNLLKSLGITHILNMAGSFSANFHHDDPEFTYKSYNVEDVPKAVLPIQEALEFIKHAIANDEKVLVHCIEGKSRSGSMIVAYFMSSKGMSYDEAVQEISLKRRIEPNEGFVDQLKAYFSS